MAGAELADGLPQAVRGPELSASILPGRAVGCGDLNRMPSHVAPATAADRPALLSVHRGSPLAREGGRAGGGRLHDAAAMLSHGLLWTLAFAAVIGAAVIA